MFRDDMVTQTESTGRAPWTRQRFSYSTVEQENAVFYGDIGRPLPPTPPVEVSARLLVVADSFYALDVDSVPKIEPAGPVEVAPAP